LIHAPTNTVSPDDAFSASAKVCRARAPQHYFATSFLPKRKRDAVRAIIAFCALTADALRGDPSSCDPAMSGACCGPDDSLLAMYRTRVEEIYCGKVDRMPPISQDRLVLIATELVVSSYNVPADLLYEFGEGVRNDVRVRRYATWASLERQIHRTYGALSRMIACVLGVSHSDGQRFANELGSALALMRIIENLSADWSRGYLYLPIMDLAECKCSEANIASLDSEPAKQLLSYERSRARSLFRRAAENIAWLGDDGSRMMVSLVIMTEVARLKGKSHAKSVSMRQVVSAWRLARRRAGRPLPNVI
jgi:phytoene/squalene synthetase